MPRGDVASRWAGAPPEVQEALDQRARVLLAALELPADAADAEALLAALVEALRGAGADVLWLALATLTARLPGPSQLQQVQRRARWDGPLAALDRAGLGALLAGEGPRNSAGRLPSVRVVRGAVLLDLNETAQAVFHTGIQRVARETAQRWVRDHDVLLVGWDGALPALRVLGAEERRRALDAEVRDPIEPVADEVLVPWKSSYVLPELIVERTRVEALHGLFASGANQSMVVGHDCVPLTTVEVVGGVGMADGFAAYLAALGHVTCVAATCGASAAEFLGWRGMLVGAGVVGPVVRVVGLPAVARVVSGEVVERVASLYSVAGLPLVLVVGSHEPRKNHLVVLQAAELLWREGLAFSVTFVGGNAWASEAFRGRLADLAAAGRPVNSVSAAPDEDLWAAYRVARFTVFPSLNEGFGLPLAESLAAGTPVVTSGFGSMAEVAAGGGALLVDPRDAGSVAGAMRRLLTDDRLCGLLAAEARARPVRDWDDYAAELWDTLPAVMPAGLQAPGRAPGEVPAL